MIRRVKLDQNKSDVTTWPEPTSSRILASEVPKEFMRSSALCLLVPILRHPGSAEHTASTIGTHHAWGSSALSQ